MLFVRRVSGESMVPTLRDEQIIVGTTSLSGLQLDDIVVVSRGGKEIIKRVTRLKSDSVWVEGDNPGRSTDSRQFDWIAKSDILGVMKHVLPLATDPPKLRTPFGAKLGWVAAVVLIGLSLLHLFRIDTLVPEIARVFGNNATLAFWAASFIVTMEVFALPFLMRMRLSPLARYISGSFAVLVPLFWLLVSIWTYGRGVSTAQLGEFVALPSSWLLLVVNAVWLVFSYYVIWALGYDYSPREKQTFVTKFFSRLSK